MLLISSASCFGRCAGNVSACVLRILPASLSVHQTCCWCSCGIWQHANMHMMLRTLAVLLLCATASLPSSVHPDSTCCFPAFLGGSTPLWCPRLALLLAALTCQFCSRHLEFASCSVNVRFSGACVQVMSMLQVVGQLLLERLSFHKCILVVRPGRECHTLMHALRMPLAVPETSNSSVRLTS